MSKQRTRPTISVPSIRTSTSLVHSPLASHHAEPLDVQDRPSATRRKGTELDLSKLPPDELFSKYMVSDVKTIQNKLRGEADAKQEELRLMVGERYRDLLQASTSIISISAGSKRVLSALNDVQDACPSDQSDSPQSFPHQAPKKGGRDDGQLSVLQSLSAHLKLLLDAPEQLWRLLEQHSYLHAAWLFLVSRVVYRSLVKDEDEEDEEGGEVAWSKENIYVSDQFPLAQRQWETVSQFRHQITHKATQDLRLYTRTPRETCDTLVAILLLDSIPLSETLSLLLSQRSKALRSMFAKLVPTLSTSSPIRSRPTSPISPDRRQNRELAATLLSPRSLSPAAQAPNGVENKREVRARRKAVVSTVQNTLAQVLNLITGTVETGREIYIGDEQNKKKPLVEQLLDSVQGASLDSSKSKRAKHVSRMSIISSFHATPSPILPVSQTLTTIHILESLPSSQLLIQFLPPSISSYSPYIDTTSAASQLSRSQAASACTSWFNGCLSTLEGKLRIWFEDLRTIREVWEVRSVIESYRERLSETEFASVSSILDEACKDRAREIWEASLRTLERQSDKLISRFVKEIQAGGDLATTSDPIAVATTPIPLPSIFAASSIHQDTSFSSYRNALENRLSVRTPAVAKTVASLEQSARRFKKDYDFIEKDPSTVQLSQRLLATYEPDAIRTSLNIAHMMMDTVQAASSSSQEQGNDNATDAVIFLGRIALELSTVSTFFQLLCRQRDVPHELQRAMQKVYLDSVNVWRQRSVEKALLRYRAHSRQILDPPRVKASGLRASAALTQALLVFSKSIQQLGLPHFSLRADCIPEMLLEEFHERFSQDTELPLDDSQVQWDLAFIQRLLQTFNDRALNGQPMNRKTDDGGEDLSTPNKATSPSNGDTTSVSDVLKTSLDVQLARWQVLLGPLVGEGARPLQYELVSLTKRPSSSILLPFGAIPAQEDFQPALELIKPGPRFGMLLVGSGPVRSAT